jgi:tRNA wybutosine-synthesizing protein 1
LSADKETLLRGTKVPASKTARRIVGVVKKSKPEGDIKLDSQKIQVLVFFSSLTGNTEKTAKAFTEQITKAQTDSTIFLEPQLHDLSYIDYDDYFITPPKSDNTSYFYLILIPSYNIDTVLDNFLEHLQETHNDFRIDTAPLSPLLGYSVFGFGDREGWPTEEEGFCSQARDVDKWMAKLTGRKRAFPLGVGDSKKDAEARLKEWREGIENVLATIAETGSLGEGVVGSGDAVESDVEDGDESDGEVLFEEQKVAQQKAKAQKKDGLNDLEDIGDTFNAAPEPLEVDFTTYSKRAKPVAPIATKEMVPKNSPTYNALTKQG